MHSPTDPFGIVGQVLDAQFRVDRLVGEGGFSAVYRGHHLGLDEPIAIKCLKLPPSLEPPLVEQFVNRFRDESRILYRLSRGNLHIVRSITAGTWTSPQTRAVVPYMILEWLEGRSLANEFTVRRTTGHVGRPLDEIVKLFGTAADALAYAHAQGVIHRDLNPGNLFLTNTPQGQKLKVLDFGVAKIMHDSSLNLGPRAQTVGAFRIFAPAYGAPEQFDDAIGPISAASDVYAFALVILEAMRDRAVNDGTSLGEFMHRTLDPAQRPTPRALGMDVPDEIERALARGTALDPRERWQSVGEMWQAFTIGVNVASERKHAQAARETPPLSMPTGGGVKQTQQGMGPIKTPARIDRTMPLGAVFPNIPRPVAKTPLPPAFPTGANADAGPRSASPGVGGAPASNRTGGAPLPPATAAAPAGQTGQEGHDLSKQIKTLPPGATNPQAAPGPQGQAGAQGAPPGMDDGTRRYGAAKTAIGPAGIGVSVSGGVASPMAPSSLGAQAPGRPARPPTPISALAVTAVPQPPAAKGSDPTGVPLANESEENEDEVTKVHAPEPDVLRELFTDRTLHMVPGARPGPPVRPAAGAPMPTGPMSGGPAHGMPAPLPAAGMPAPLPAAGAPPPSAPHEDGDDPNPSPPGGTLLLSPQAAAAARGPLPPYPLGDVPPPMSFTPPQPSMPHPSMPHPSMPGAHGPPHGVPPAYPSGHGLSTNTPPIAMAPHSLAQTMPLQGPPGHGPQASFPQNLPAHQSQLVTSPHAPMGALTPANPMNPMGPMTPPGGQAGISGGYPQVGPHGQPVAPPQAPGVPNALPPAQAQPGFAPAPGFAPREPAPTTPPQPPKNNSVILFGAAAGVLLLVGVGGIAIWATSGKKTAAGLDASTSATAATTASAPPSASASATPPPPEPEPAADAAVAELDEDAGPTDASSADATPEASTSAAATTAVDAGSSTTPSWTVPEAGTWPPPKDAGPPPDPNAWNESLARARLSQANGVLVICRKEGGVTGPGTASVTFGTDGTVSSVALDAPYAGTKEGDCAAGQFRRSKVNAFNGSPQTLRHSFEIPK